MTGAILPACIKNVSFGGIYVESSTNDLWVHAPIRITFKVQQDGELRKYSWRGFITRLSNHGAGAMFESSDPDEQAGLLALLNFADNIQVPQSVAC